ncbi:MAG: DUF4912 domain-containing protein [Candidatus Schekmanbacteria bacterium]|nr:DUF4912 domain-containing protein [Candidatus Schekmanbacteria bacterium]
MSAMTQKELYALRKTQLLELARKYKIDNCTSLSKQDLVDKVLLAFNHTKSRSEINYDEAKASKYYLGPEVKYSETINELPTSYGNTEIVLLVRDPYWVFAYWEITPQSLDKARWELGEQWYGCRKVMRIYDITNKKFDGANANSCFDVEINGANNWYVRVNNPNRAYCADLGLITPQGGFYLLSRSNHVSTPRATPSEIYDEVWWSDKEKLAPVYKPLLQSGFSSGDIQAGRTRK